jgi:hypothetical protein
MWTVWMLVVGLVGWHWEMDLNPWWSDPIAFGVLLGLFVAAAGATLAGLSGAVPGLEKDASAGWTIAGVGLFLVAGTMLWGAFGQSAQTPSFQLSDCLWCGAFALAFAAAPMVLASGFIMRGWVANPLPTAFAAAGGAVGLGAVAVHAMCLDAGSMHILLGHLFMPLSAAGLLAIPLAAFVHRR